MLGTEPCSPFGRGAEPNKLYSCFDAADADEDTAGAENLKPELAGVGCVVDDADADVGKDALNVNGVEEIGAPNANFSCVSHNQFNTFHVRVECAHVRILLGARCVICHAKGAVAFW